MAKINLVPNIHAPYLSPTNANSKPVQNTVWGQSPLFNFATGEFYINESGGLVMGNEAQTLLQWCRKALMTQRYKWKAYTSDFGNELIGYLGVRSNDGILAMIAKSAIYRILTRHSCIKIVSQPKITQKADQLYSTTQFVTIAGQKKEFDAIFQNTP